MKYFILDDDMNVVKILKNIIEEDFNRQVIGTSDTPSKAIDEITLLRPDVVLIDYLMPKLDGVDVMKKIKSYMPEIEFIMISQVSEKDMIAEAYKEGLGFFISKPINKIEVNVVLNHMAEKIQTVRKLNQIVSLLGQPDKRPLHSQLEVSKSVLKDLGIYSEKGSKDMVSIVELKVNHDLCMEDAFSKYADMIHDKPKIIRQRIRRAANRALRNLAYLGIEDYMNDLFVKYSSSLFDFESVKKEMDYIRGVNKYKGSVSLDKFLENLCEF